MNRGLGDSPSVDPFRNTSFAAAVSYSVVTLPAWRRTLTRLDGFQESSSCSLNLSKNNRCSVALASEDDFSGIGDPEK